ncbi:Protein tyrosine kinase [Hyphomicrobiales bacterium]|nr:Protein tyrosine kinase [Hyphomicrobiales bacterium]CAH1699156.1 Protein tyrosine kinase [Hyphomicrobiales bacterium]CAI0342942.1 polysaccharide biosynthesis transport protein [Hyphomicrobiales bacterium]
MLHSNMSQTDRSHATIVGAPGEGEGGIGVLVDFALSFLRRQYVIIIFATTIALGLSVVYLRITPPTYSAQVRILLGNPKAQFFQQQSLLAEPVFDLNQLETQIQLIRSSAIATAVIKQLKLFDDPDFNSPPFSLAAILQKIRAWISPPPKQPDNRTTDQMTESLIGAFQGRLQANRVSFSNVVEISFSSSSAARAAEIANAVANAYIADQLNARFETNRSATAWLQERLRDLNEQALTAERAVNAYRVQNNIVSSGGTLIDEQKITDLNSRLVAARAQTADAQNRLNNYTTVLRSSSDGSNAIGALGAAGPDTLASPIINNLRQQYLELVRRESEWAARFGRNHLAVINLRTRMRDLHGSILDEVRRLAEVSRSDYESARQRQQEIERQLNEAVSLSRTTNTAEITLRELETRAKNFRSLYDNFLQRYTGSVQQETFPISDARVIYPAMPPDSKSKPKTPLILALGIFGGLGLGIGLGLLRDAMDRVFRTSAQLEAALHLHCLSMVPRWHAPKRPPPSEIRQPDEDPHRQTLSVQPSVNWAVIDMPLSRFAEAIRAIKLGIDLSPADSSSKVIGITSTVPNEGKTTIAASLAQLIGHSGKSVIVVDCDLRNPSLSASLAPNATAGIVEVIHGRRSLDETVWQHPKTGLAFLPAVRRGPLLHTSEILSADATQKLFARLRAAYDYVIVDLPPLSPVVDVRVTGALIDGFILVVEWGRTKTDVVQHALHTAPNIYERMIGAVLNKTDIRAMKRYNSYLSDYYSDNHYARYSESDSRPQSAQLK